MRRWTLLLAGAALWLFLAAIPALADGGPHVSSVNNGSSTLTADSCAGCHRAHTASGPMLLNAPTEEALCLTCHGASSTGATTDVMTGVQYAPATDGTRTGTQLGALRGGGFVEARIDAGNAYRYTYGLNTDLAHPTIFGFDKKVGVGATEAVTSAHLKLAGATGVTTQGTAWGNGPFAATANAGPAVTISCGSCHNPHGNGKYRILNPIPDPVTGAVVAVSPNATSPINVTDAANPTNATRNYTVIQAKAGGGRYLLASEIVADAVNATSGDYWHQVVPYNAGVTDSTVANHDAPNGDPSFFNGQINAWCSTCHSRYTQSTNFTQSGGVPVPGSAEVAGNLRTRVCVIDATTGTCTYPNNDQPMVQGTGDGIYNYRHTTSRNRSCLTCHVSHGSNAAMTGPYAAAFPYPDGDTASSSRLLKVDNRGTCQVCHDPTQTTTIGSMTNGPAPALP